MKLSYLGIDGHHFQRRGEYRTTQGSRSNLDVMNSGTVENNTVVNIATNPFSYPDRTCIFFYSYNIEVRSKIDIKYYFKY